MSDEMTLLPCPFCGGEAHTLNQAPKGTGYSVGCPDDECRGFIALSWIYKTEAEAIAAWNNRTPIEYDGWFYLPKPKEGIVVYGEPEITRTENGYKVRQIADVVDEAARKWGEELGEYVMQRICEIWNSRAERTCHDVRDRCSLCDGILYGASYCPNCGAKIIGGNE